MESQDLSEIVECAFCGEQLIINGPEAEAHIRTVDPETEEPRPEAYHVECSEKGERRQGDERG